MDGLEREVERFNRKFCLTEEEDEGGAIDAGLWNNENKTHALCLVGRVLTTKVYKFEALSTSIKGMFNPVKGMECIQLTGGRFLLHFFHAIDRDRALDGCPWSFDRNIIILSMIQTHKTPMQVNLDWCDFHVHVHDLPLSKMNLGIATYIGNRLGRFKDMDMDDLGSTWGATLRMRVSVDVNLHLKRVLKIRTPSGDDHMVSFTYERLTNFCYLCGRLGHISKYCGLRFEEGFSDPGTDTLMVLGSERPCLSVGIRIPMEDVRDRDNRGMEVSSGFEQGGVERNSHNNSPGANFTAPEGEQHLAKQQGPHEEDDAGDSGSSHLGLEQIKLIPSVFEGNGQDEEVLAADSMDHNEQTFGSGLIHVPLRFAAQGMKQHTRGRGAGGELGASRWLVVENDAEDLVLSNPTLSMCKQVSDVPGRRMNTLPYLWWWLGHSTANRYENLSLEPSGVGGPLDSSDPTSASSAP
ncbi:UNVERIFIED_CONTAM: hypothetical protein Slati_1513800 [Sesamum latifolium]|uniref:CCHC-type domain-containing protein n=1 Tax=Sesamum latifolium TaxID=2727402 RepID=A0AAW2X6Y2_9LAMI